MGQTSDKPQHRFTGRQMTAVVIAVCAAVILTPVSVTAATAWSKVSIVDQDQRRNAVEVSPTGQLMARVAGTVRVAPGVSGTAFHREGNVEAATAGTVGEPFPAGKNIAVGSINVIATNAGGWNQLFWEEANASGQCDGSGADVGVVSNFYLSGSQNFNKEFPVPQIRTGRSVPLCLRVLAAGTLHLVVDGYTY